MIPVLLKPALQGLKNRWLDVGPNSRQTFQDFVIGTFCVAIMCLIFHGTKLTLDKVHELQSFLYLPPSHPLGLIFLLLAGMLLVSALAIAVGALFLGRDLDLIVSSPLSTWQFFKGKFAYIFLTSSWMPILFLLPFLVAFGISYEAGPTFYIATAALLLPFFFIPTALAIILATLYTRLVPANRTREVLIICGAMLGLVIYVLFDLLDLSDVSLTSTQELIRLISVLSMSDQHWLPSTWLARALYYLIDPRIGTVGPEIVLVVSSSVALVTLSFIVIDRLHLGSYSLANNLSSKHRPNRKRGYKPSWIERIGFVPPRTSALVSKELKTFSRDMTLVIQMLFLLGIMLVYLYNLRIFRAVDTLPEGLRIGWKQLLFIGNVAMGAFISTAICTRFVFPSISLEGRASWVLFSAPLNLRELLRAKFFYWYIPVGVISSTFFAIGAFTIGANLPLILVNVLCAWVICYGLVGLGVGCSAIFAHFDWEYSTELAASFGSLVYMISSIALILVSLAPGLLFVFLSERHFLLTKNENLTLWLTGSVLILAINYLSARLALRLGEQKLLKSLK